MIASLSRLAGLNWPAPDDSTLLRRQAPLAVQIRDRCADGPVNFLVDSTGIKLLRDEKWQAQRMLGAGTGNCRFTLSSGHRGFLSGTVVLCDLPRSAPLSAIGPSAMASALTIGPQHRTD